MLVGKAVCDIHFELICISSGVTVTSEDVLSTAK
jgi:hypothetical protein